MKNRTITVAGAIAAATIPLLASGGPASAAQQSEPLAAPVVVQSVATRGPGGVLHEHIDLRNVTTTSFDISGWQVKACNPLDGVWSTLYTVPGTPGTPTSIVLTPRDDVTNSSTSSWTIVNAASPSPPSGFDDPYSGDVSDFGGVGIYDSSGSLVDSVGFSSVCSTLPAEPQRSNTDPSNSRNRLGTDTNLDRVDFQKL